MGSKKHKKDSKKKKHKSRSRSPINGEELERKRHKKHKDRKKDRSPDVEEVPVDSHLAAEPERSRSASRDRRIRDQRRHHREREEHEHRERSRSASPAGAGGAGGAGGGAGGGGGAAALSVDDTNRLRAKLGLKPLEVNEPPAEDGKLKDDLGEFYHKPAANLAAATKADKLRQKLLERKEKRSIEHKLKTKTLGEASDEDDDPMAWVQRSRILEKQKQEAAKRAAMLDEMDAVFGVTALEPDQLPRYGADSLKGLRVAHDLDHLGDERETILTLEDKEVLAEDKEDVLINVNIKDDQRYKKNIAELKKARAGYQAYDEEAELAIAMGAPRAVLAKYDDEITPDRAAKDAGFLIGDDDALHAKKFRDMMRAERMGADKRLESLQLPALRVASDYYSEQEISAKFKKVKRKGTSRRRAKHEPIDVEEYDPGAAPLHTDDTEVKMEQLQQELVQDAAETEPDAELQAALHTARRLKRRALLAALPEVEELLETVKSEGVKEETEEAEEEGGMVLDATAEFCRTLGHIPTYGQAGNRDHRAEIIDFEQEEVEMEAEAAEAAGGAWARVDVERDAPPDLAAERGGGLGAEPALGAGVAGALQLALSKGYLERAGAAPAPPSQHRHLLAARHYSIDDKAHAADEERHGRRERAHHGPLTDFREKPAFRPAVKLEYVDDDGRPLCPKEAFRYLSHKFHGKGPAKNKQEKRLKKQLQEGLMKKMSSTDTPLNTLQMLQDKQKETHSPYVVLSGAKTRPAH